MLPTQATVDWLKPEQHLAWGMRNMPMLAGVGCITNPGILSTWSKHLYHVGFRHVDYIRSLADADGNIHVSQLPKQKIKWMPPFRGSTDQYNNAARWAEVGTPDPPMYRIPDIRELTQQENEAMLAQYRDAGMLSAYQPPPDTAKVM